MKKIIDWLKAWLQANSLLIICIIGLYLKTILFYNNTIAIEGDIKTHTMIATLVWISLILLPFSYWQNSRKKWICLIIVYFIISFLLCADEIYYTYSSDLLAVAQISNLQYTNEIMGTLPTLIKWTQALYFIDIVLFLIIYKMNFIKLPKNKQGWSLAIINTIFIVLMIPSCIKLGIETIYLEPYQKSRQIEDGTVYGYHIMDIVNSFQTKKQTKFQTYEEVMQEKNRLDEYEQEHFEEFYDVAGKGKGKSVLLLQLEAVQNFVINKEINGKEITPNLNDFLEESLCFTNLHAQSFTTTADSEHSVISSLYPMENGQSFSKYYTNTYPDIFYEFSNSGYYTSYYHGNTGTFWNRKNVFSHKSVNDINFIEQFQDTSETINTYLSDELLYRQAVEKMKNYNKPFLANIVAASSHTPFELSGIQDKEKKVTIDVGKYKGTLLGNYLEAVNYADYAFGILLEQLKKENLYEDLILVVYGDHFGIPIYDEELDMYLKEQGIERNDVQKQLDFTNLVCGIRIPGVEPEQIDTIVSKIDIKPTILEITGIENTFSLGTSMFSSKDYVCLNNGRIITKNYYYDGIWREIQTGNEINLDELEESDRKKLQEYKQNMESELDISKSITVHDLLKGKY